jgi:hypothetical protein
MSKRTTVSVIALICFLIGVIVGGQMPFVYAQGGKTKDPNWLYGLNLKARKSTEDDFTKDTKKYGIEVFKDENTNHYIYISETGSIAVVPAK